MGFTNCQSVALAAHEPPPRGGPGDFLKRFNGSLAMVVDIGNVLVIQTSHKPPNATTPSSFPHEFLLTPALRMSRTGHEYG